MNRWDIFCKRVDNFGDIGVCWRLARQLVREHDRRVRLWVDDWATLRRLVANCPAQAGAVMIDGVELLPWSAVDVGVRPAEVVIEAFACALPPAYRAVLTASTPPPVWICLEYLSAEPWVEGCHRLPSADPLSGRQRLTFFPGFTPRTGGLIREADLFARRERAQAEGGRLRWLDRHPLTQAHVAARWVSLFAYDNQALGPLLTVWQAGSAQTVLWVPEGRALKQAATCLDLPVLGVGECVARGALLVCGLPFLPMGEYDTLLALCDVNFVRGEDSFVRAQWAARPFVWQIYAQAEAVHRVKLEAFFDRYGSGLAPPDRDALHALWLAWNGWGEVDAAWRRVEPHLAALSTNARKWCDTLAQQEDLAKQLVNCVRHTLK